MPLLDLDPDQLLSTTRTVRKPLDFTRPVDDDLIRQCVRMALQAPSGGNNVTMRVTRPSTGRGHPLGPLVTPLLADFAEILALSAKSQSRRSRTTTVSSRPGPTPITEIGAVIICSSAAT